MLRWSRVVHTPKATVLPRYHCVLTYVQAHLYTWCPSSPRRLHYKSLMKLVSSPVPLSNTVHKSTPYMQASKKLVNNKNTQLLIGQWGGGLEIKKEGTFIYQRTMPSPTALKRSLVLGFMGMTCRQSGSFSRALFIQLTKAYFSSSADKELKWLRCHVKARRRHCTHGPHILVPKSNAARLPRPPAHHLGFTSFKNQSSLKKQALNQVIKIHLKIQSKFKNAHYIWIIINNKVLCVGVT